MNKAIFQRLKKTHAAWEAEELAYGEATGGAWAERDATYPDLLVLLRDLPAAERILQGAEATARIPELLGAWRWSDFGIQGGAPSLAFQVGFARGAVAVLEDYETALAAEWSSGRPKRKGAG